MLTHYLKITLRTIRKEKFRYIITTLGIAVGIVIFSAVLLMVDGIKSNFFAEIPNADKLYRLTKATLSSDGEKRTGFQLSAKDLKEIKKLSIPDIDKIGIIDSNSDLLYICNSDDENKMFQARRSKANGEILELLDIKFIEGGINENITDKNQIIITDKYANLLFGTTKAVGNSAYVYDTNNVLVGSYTVVGVIKIKNPINYRDFMFDFFIPSNFKEEEIDVDIDIDADNSYHYIRSSTQGINTIVSLKKDFDIERVNAMLKTYKIGKSKNRDDYVELLPYSDPMNKLPMVLLVVMILMGSMVLVISLFNYINLLISSMQARVRQFSLRKIVGAQPWTFVTMIIVEILPVIIVSILLSYFLLELFVHLWSSNTSIDDSFTDILRMIFAYPFKIGFWMLVGSVILSFIMSKRLQKIVLTQGIRGEAFSLNKNRVRNILLVIELMLTLIFINTSIFFIITMFNSISKQYQPLSKAQSKATLYVPLDKLNLISEREEITNRIKSISGVSLVIDGFYLGNMYTGGEVNGNSVSIRANNMFNDYAEFWELDDPIYKRKLSPTEAIINKTFADKLLEDNLNSFKLGSREYNVVGVVDEVPCTKKGDYSIIYGGESHDKMNSIYVKCDPKSKERVQKEIIKIIREYLPATIVYRITSIDDSINKDTRILITYATIMLIASLFSIIITVLGIYSSITYDVNRKRKEIAIRKINGASRKDVLMFLSKAYVIIILVAGTLSALLHRFLITKMFQSLRNINTKYNILFDIGILLLMTLVIAAIVSLKIRKAMSENPSEVIKSE